MFAHKRTALAVALCFVAPVGAFAQANAANPTASVELSTVVVTGNPLGSALFDLVSPVSVLEGRELNLRRESTLGETVSQLPGVSSSYFGPNASRPMIRGLDGDRIRILQNGTGMQDVSSLSPDHATAVDPLTIERVEVVRGPAALLYGGNAVGGVVNVLDGRIPTAPVTGVGGRAEVRGGSVDNERSGAALLEAGNGQFALHFDTASRKTSDLSIPDYARSARKRAADPQTEEVRGTLRNSNGRADSGTVGASLTFDDGYLGAAFSRYTSNYGTVAEPNVRIGMENTRYDLAGEKRNLSGFIDSLKFKSSYTDYAHDELDNGTPATRFRTKGRETRIEATHRPLAGLRGAFGVQFGNLDFSAAGDEAFLPTVDSRSKAVFLFEEASLGTAKLTLGGRIEQTRHQSSGGGTDDASTSQPRFGSANSRSFTGKSGALGLVQPLTGAFSVAANLSHTERAPTYAELYANGVHAATNLYEVGNAQLELEKSNSLDAQLRWRQGRHSASLGGYLTRFDNYIGLSSTGSERCADGAAGAGAGSCGGEDPVAEHRFTAVKAEFKGMEAEGKFRLFDRADSLDLRLRADYVRATNRETGAALPRISPLRLGVGADYRLAAFGARVDVIHAFAQNRVASGELPTDAYTLVNLALTYQVPWQGATVETFLRAQNLLDREARVHTSYLKDVAPLPGRGIQLGLRASF